MSEINYSKKQIQPLVDKFKINVETNTVFKRIIAMFDSQTNYQIWAIKNVFGHELTLEGLENIKVWSDNNQTLIKELSKKNIVSYSNNREFELLFSEMTSLDMISFVKSCVSRFNTAQRDMLRAEIFKTPVDSLTANNNPIFHRWFELLSKFETMADHRKKKFISTSSALMRLSDLKTAIEATLKETYEWNKDDLLSYIGRNASDCKVIFNEGNVLVVNVPSFDSSQKLGGNGRTQWCLAREERYFKQYVIEPRDNKQYFLFNFSKRENDELAYIGFTVNGSTGICNGHTTKNNSLLGDGISYNNIRVNINKALQLSGVNLGAFLKLKPLKFFKWEIENLLVFIESLKNEFAIVNSVDNRVIVRALTNEALNKLISHTLVDCRNYALGNTKNIAYVMFDFNLNNNDDKSVVVMEYRKDNYNIDSLHSMRDGYNTDITKDNYLEKIGISPESFLNREAIDPSILLHKLIDEKSENDAIIHINKQGDDFDVNFVFNQRVPIFSAVNNKMYKLFSTIINHKSFNSSVQDGLLEPLLPSLLYPYRYYSENKNSGELTPLKTMIEAILNSTIFDYNALNINEDSAINIACEHPSLNWIVESLVSKPSVNVNMVNDYNCAALGNAIRFNNIEAIKILGKRPDLVIREEDKELAAKGGINLNELIKPEAFTNVATTTNVKNDEYTKVFKSVFASAK